MTRVHPEAELIGRRHHAQRWLWRTLGLPSRWAHRRADQLLDRLDSIDFLTSELAREEAA